MEVIFIKNLKIINDYLYSYYENLFFYNKCDLIFKDIISKEDKNIFFKDSFRPCSEYIYKKLIPKLNSKGDVFIILDENYNTKKIKAIYQYPFLKAISENEYDYNLDLYYYNKSNNIIKKMIDLKSK